MIIANKGWVVVVKVEPQDICDISMPIEDEFQVEDNGMTSSANLFNDVYQDMESSYRRVNASDSICLMWK